MFMIILWMVAIILAVVCILESAKRKRAECDLADAQKQIAEERKHSELLVAERDETEKKLIACEKKCDKVLNATANIEKELAARNAERDKIAFQSAEYAKKTNAALTAANKRAEDVEQHLFRNWTMISNDGRVRTYMRDCIYMRCDGENIEVLTDKENDRITAIVENDEIAGYYRPDGPADVPDVPYGEEGEEDEETAGDTENAPDVNCMPDDEDAE